MRREVQIVILLAVAPAFLHLCGCVKRNSPTSLAGPGTIQGAEDMTSHQAAGSAHLEPVREKYVLQNGDLVDVRFFYAPELNETVTIRPDGYISLQLIPEVKAVGLTPSQLATVLSTLYSDALRHAEVTVIVREFGSQTVYVGGEVTKVGAVPVRGTLTCLQAILLAGGFKSSAKRSCVVVLRDQGTDTPLFLKLDLKHEFVGPTGSNDIILQPRDIVFVSKSDVARLGDFVDQYFNQLVPAFFSFGLMYNLNPEVTVTED